MLVCHLGSGSQKLQHINAALRHDRHLGQVLSLIHIYLVLPAGYAGDKVELLTQMEQFIKEQDPTYNCIIKVEQSYTCLLYTSRCV